jgi:hypothetical protein
MPGQRIGSLIAAAFGLIYVLVNAAGLPTAWALALRVLAVAGFVAVLVAVWRAPGRRGPRQGPAFGRAYWLVVAVELMMLFVGARLLSGPLHAPQAGVAWVSLVVGVHFFALGAVFAQRFFHWLGGVITACGAAGLGLAAGGQAAPAIAVVGGVLPGAVLLGFGWWGARRRESSAGPLQPPSESRRFVGSDPTVARECR